MLKIGFAHTAEQLPLASRDQLSLCKLDCNLELLSGAQEILQLRAAVVIPGGPDEPLQKLPCLEKHPKRRHHGIGGPWLRIAYSMHQSAKFLKILRAEAARTPSQPSNFMPVPPFGQRFTAVHAAVDMR